MKYNNEEIKNAVTESWKNAFSMEEFDENESIFVYGGNSLHITKIVDFLKEKYDIELELEDVFNNDTINSLADFIAANKN